MVVEIHHAQSIALLLSLGTAFNFLTIELGILAT
jgi:hypothetical protein